MWLLVVVNSECPNWLCQYHYYFIFEEIVVRVIAIVEIRHGLYRRKSRY